MGILSFIVNVPGQGGMKPRRPKLITTDNLATVQLSGYLNSQVEQGNIVETTDIIDAFYSYSEVTKVGTYGSFTVALNGGNVTLTENSGGGGGGISPGTVGNVAVYTGSTQLGDGGGVPVVTVKNTGQTISASTTSTTPTLTTLNVSVTKTGSGMTGGELIGVLGQVSSSTLAGGELYGVEGKVTLTGTASGAAEVSCLHAHLDIDSVDMTGARISCILADMGTTAEIGTFSELYGMIIANDTPSVPNAAFFVATGADFLFELFDQNAIVGATYFRTAGTGAGSAGDITKCNASKVITIEVNGTSYWIPLFASNS